MLNLKPTEIMDKSKYNKLTEEEAYVILNKGTENPYTVTPAQAGAQFLGSRLRGNDDCFRT